METEFAEHLLEKMEKMKAWKLIVVDGKVIITDKKISDSKLIGKIKHNVCNESLYSQ